MRFSTIIGLSALSLASCGGPESGNGSPATAPSGVTPSSPSARMPAAAAPKHVWKMHSREGDATLTLLMPSNTAVIRLACHAQGGRLAAEVPAFRQIGSEDRLTIGSNGDAVALVAETRRAPVGGGVRASGAVPEEMLRRLLAERLSAVYGTQRSGPHPTPPEGIARSFAAACTAAGQTKATPRQSVPSPSACMMQDRQALRTTSLRAVGTEPFWAARVEGRCVTYSHPEDQDGTRIWTRYTGDGSGGTWSGALNGRLFELRTAPAPNCSDGMSDKLYPHAVELTVNGERRSGCAEPL